jgi:DNA-binding MarR family transcriptional regulator/GTPase SAR1 family protein
MPLTAIHKRTTISGVAVKQNFAVFVRAVYFPCVLAMVSSSQKRILVWLNQFSSDIEKSWDVSRDIALPGIADGLGVVRSALNLPLKKLEKSGMVFKRMGHVIGGGSRRRQVFHITDKGREYISSQDSNLSKKSKTGKIFGSMPSHPQVFGRDEDISKINDRINDTSLLISGLPGIGKTTVISALSQQLLDQEKTVRWATASDYTDAYDLCSQWEIGNSLPQDNVALESMIIENCKNQILVVDDIHLISKRHNRSIDDLCQKLSKVDTLKLILIGREPITSYSYLEKVKILPLDDEYGAQILGGEQNLDERMSISKRLGGHPLALQLYQPESELPEQSTDIQNYVEKIVLSNLSEEQKSSLNLLSLEPIPIASNNSLVSEMIGVFDDQALLRWSSNNLKVELHHLIRNVRRSFIDLSEQKNLHNLLVNHWQSIDRNDDEDLILLYHQIASSKDNIIQLIENQLSNLSPKRSNILAVLIEQAIDQIPHNSDLHYFAAKVAAKRCEVDYLKHHIENIKDERSIELKFDLALFEGRLEDAEKLFVESLEVSNADITSRLSISAASRRLEDRIFDEEIDDTIIKETNKYLSEVEIGEISNSSKSASIIAISLIKHSLSLLQKDLINAQKITESVQNLGLQAESLVLSMRSKEFIFELKNGTKSLDEAKQFIEKAILSQSNQIYKDSIRLNFIEALTSLDMELAKVQFELLGKPDDEIRLNTYNRYVARWWLCRSIIEPSQKLTSLRESISQHKLSGCPRAARVLERRLHSLI